MAKKIIVNGGFIVLSDEVINELHRQERIEEGNVSQRSLFQSVFIIKWQMLISKR